MDLSKDIFENAAERILKNRVRPYIWAEVARRLVECNRVHGLDSLRIYTSVVPSLSGADPFGRPVVAVTVEFDPKDGVGDEPPRVEISPVMLLIFGGSSKLKLSSYVGANGNPVESMSDEDLISHLTQTVFWEVNQHGGKEWRRLMRTVPC